jgi:hypothetical protein
MAFWHSEGGAGKPRMPWEIQDRKLAGASQDKKENGMRVKNLNGTPQNTRTSGSWLAYWELYSGQNAYMCVSDGCIMRPSVGAHVQMDSPTDKSWYVIPLCADCSKKRGQDLDIWDMAKLVPVNSTGIVEKAAAFHGMRVRCGA